MTETTKLIADKARGVAAEKRFTQERIAATLGLSRTSVAERYSGRIPFTAPEIFALASALDVDIARFFPERVAS